MNTNVRQAERVIDESEVVALIEDCIAKIAGGPGRPRELSVRTLCVAHLLLPQSGRSHLIRIPEVLNALPAADRKRLGITRKGGVTYRQVTRLYVLITKALDHRDERTLDDRLVDFDTLCDRLAYFSAHPEARKLTSISLDATDIATWGTNRRRKSKKVDTVGQRVATDPDALYRGAKLNKKQQSSTTRDLPKKPPLYGYEMTTATTIRALGGNPVPFATTSMRFRPVTKGTKKMGLAVVLSHQQRVGQLGDVLFDRGYNQSNDGSDFILPIRALGGEPVFQLQSDQIGPSGTQHGAIIIDGQPFSPSLPQRLRVIPQPHVKSDIGAIVAYQDAIAERSKYAMVPHGSRKATAAQVYQCPASTGLLICPLVPSSQNLRIGTMPAVYAPSTPIAGGVCTKKYQTFQADEVPLSQRELFGSREWYESMNRRKAVEGFFGNIKDHARENFRRGSVRVRGLVKTGLLAAFNVASVNMRMANKWDAERGKTHKPAKPRMGRPRKIGVTRHAEVFSSLASANAPPAA